MIGALQLFEGAEVKWRDNANTLDATMTGTAVRYSDWLELGPEISEVSWQVPWTGTPVGTFTVQVSNGPGSTPTPDPVAATATVVNPNNNTNVGALMSVVTRAKYARLVYTNSSGTGALGTTYAHGKRRS